MLCERSCAPPRTAVLNPIDISLIRISGAASNHGFSIKPQAAAQITALDLVYTWAYAGTVMLAHAAHGKPVMRYQGAIAGVRSTDPLLVNAACAMGITMWHSQSPARATTAVPPSVRSRHDR